MVTCPVTELCSLVNVVTSNVIRRINFECNLLVIMVMVVNVMMVMMFISERRVIFLSKYLHVVEVYCLFVCLFVCLL